MTEEVNLVQDLAVILIAAGVFTIISKALKQPLILGYIIAGFLVGPHSPFFPNLISSQEAINQWSEIGIVFLLFGLGLEFSFKKLLKVGSAAMITAGINCIVMFFIGVVTGTALGWSSMECTFLGGMMSMSSTTIIVKAYGDLNLNNKPYAPLVFGTLVVEDLIAVLLMVLLTTLAVSRKFSGSEMLLGLGKLLLFLVLCFLIGMYVLPPLFRKARKYLSDEILLIISIGLCFGMVSVAEYFGFSSALGAFLMGSLLSETIEGERIHKLSINIKDLFGAIFFVSVGMMVDVAIIGQYWGSILTLTLVAMAGITLVSIAGVLIAGKDLDTAVHTGFSLAQLGEFSFIIAGLGVSLGVMSSYIYPLIISVSVITTFTTPYMIKAATPVSAWLQSKLPVKFLAAIQRRSENQGGAAEQNEWVSFIKAYILRIVLYGSLIWLVSVVSTEFLLPLVDKFLPWLSANASNLIKAGSLLFLLSPFLYGMSVTVGSTLRKSALKLVGRNRSNRYPIMMLVILRVVLAVIIMMLVIISYLKLSAWMLPVVFLFLFAIVFVSRFTMHRFNRMEDRFFENLNARERHAREAAPVAAAVSDNLSQYGIESYTFTLAPESAYAGLALKQLPYRRDLGVSVVKIARGHKTILIPDGDEKVFPCDRLVVVGTKAQIESFKQSMEEKDQDNGAESSNEDNYVMESVLLDSNSFLTGRKLKDSGIRQGGCMVICVLRDTVAITNPSPDYCFAEGDLVWLAGDRNNIEMLK